MSQDINCFQTFMTYKRIGMVSWAHAKLEVWIRFLVGHTEDIKNSTCGLSTFVFDISCMCKQMIDRPGAAPDIPSMQNSPLQ